MKGILLSLIAVGIVVVSSAVMAHVLRPRRHLPLFSLCSLVGALGYTALFAMTPSDLGFLAKGWQCESKKLDFVYGLAAYALNCHTWIDVFFATCGGFSSAILLVMRRSGRPLNTEGVASAFRFAENNGDRIYSARIPNLVRWGYVRSETGGHRLQLTRKGRLVALAVRRIKSLMSLKAGG